MFPIRRSTAAFIPLILVSFASVSPALAFSPIVGGEEVDEKELIADTTVALLTDTPQGTGICTGSIVASDMIITAAHCVSDAKGRAQPADRVRIIFDTDVERGQKNARKALGVRVPAKYKGAQSTGKDQSDIAIVRFGGGVPSGFSVAKLLPMAQTLKNNQTVTLAGYGVITMFLGGFGEGQLRKVDVKISQAAFAKSEVLVDQRGGKGACHGDSGGPAMVKVGGVDYLWGVTNRGYPETGPDNCMQFSVYTRINAHGAFINEATKALRATK